MVMAEIVHLAKEKRKEKEVQGARPRALWSGSLRIGLVNIPIRAVPLTRDNQIHFRMLHKSCKTPVSFKRFCQEGEEVSFGDIVYGYPLGRSKYVILEKEEIGAAKPESSDAISLDRFVNFFRIDPHYFEKTYLLLPDKSEASYALLRKVMEKTGKAAIGRITLSSAEKIVLVHYYQDALVATTLRYSDEVLDPERFGELKDLPEPGEREIELAEEIVDKLSGDIDLKAYKDEYKERIEALVRSKMSDTVIAPEKKKARPAAKSLMEALRITAESLSK